MVVDVKKRCEDALILSLLRNSKERKRKKKRETDQQFGERSSVAEYAGAAFSGRLPETPFLFHFQSNSNWKCNCSGFFTCHFISLLLQAAI